ncbi:MAG: methyltransferase domain-containing protein [Pirellulales bacterium]|nr:methyltransferase domain-containing protein [Pirellulales bacterium]
MTAKPHLAPHVLMSSVADGAVVYDPASDKLHRLNALAALTVEICDGNRTVDDVVCAVKQLLPDANSDAVATWIREATEAELLCDSMQPAPTHDNESRTLSADALVELAERLRDRGKVQTAFICQQRAAELNSNDASVLRDLGELAHIAGCRDVARDAYDRYLAICPDDAVIAHLLTALRDEATPDRVPDACIEQLYERFSSFYDDNLYEELGSEVPSRLAAMIGEHLAESKPLAALDLGCGTGAMGTFLSTIAARVVGVDLSPEMIERAQNRGTYDQLSVAEISKWLAECDRAFDLIVASDTFIYFGSLSQVISPAAKILKPGGILAFSVEASFDAMYALTDSGRYVHHIDHVHQVAADAGLRVLCAEQAFQRMEYGEEVEGHYVVLGRDKV